MAGHSIVRCEGLAKTYRRAGGEVTALAEIGLEARAGEWLVVRGPSGCGKTTLLLALGGMLRPTRGRVWLEGEDLYAQPAAARARRRAMTLGFVFQMFHLVPYLTVRENVLLAAPPGAAGEVAAAPLLERLGLGARAGHRPHELSAGERQRTALARALVNRPRLLLADEPTGNLDPENAREVFAHIRAFADQGGAALVVTHGPELPPGATRVLEMRAGRLAPSS